jgi:fructoselysine-6-P-deglycase FrlB-like protein
VSKTSQELLSQPECWRAAAATAGGLGELLPQPGARVALAGCGTSLYMAQAIAAWRESAGAGETDAFAASEMPVSRKYDLVIAISRSGTTTEVVRLIDQLRPAGRVLVIAAVPGTAAAMAATSSIDLAFADEESVVQTRFATSVCALLRAHLGHDVPALAGAAQTALAALAEEPARGLTAFRQFVFLGRGAGAALASEAALKFREATLSWSEAYPAMEFRHGPVSVIGPHTLVWAIGEMDTGLEREITATGAQVRRSVGDPLVDLVTVHHGAVTLAAEKGLNPDTPRRLSRSVVLA